LEKIASWIRLSGLEKDGKLDRIVVERWKSYTLDKIVQRSTTILSVGKDCKSDKIVTSLTPDPMPQPLMM
jgi:hypothetical protein